MSDNDRVAARLASGADPPADGDQDTMSWAGWLLAGVGSATAVVAASLNPGATASAAAQVWPPFVLMAGLLLIGVWLTRTVASPAPASV
jgi:hypothetical protein